MADGRQEINDHGVLSSNTFDSAPAISDPSLTSQSRNSEIISGAIKSEYKYSMLGLALGFAAIIGGAILGVHGVTSSTSWSANLLGMESDLVNATPGVILFVVGLFMVIFTKPKVKGNTFRI